MIIDFTNYSDYPIGGYLSFAKSLIESFGNKVALVGITTEKDDPTGRWIKKTIDGTVFDFFAIARYSRSKTRHLLPDRLISFILVKLYQKKILKIQIENIFLQRQEMLLAISRLKSFNICYCFAGLENPLSISKYRYAPFFSAWFEKIFFRKLCNVGTILASGDDKSIREMIDRSNGLLTGDRVIKFPTRINTNIFKPRARFEAREILNIPKDSTMVVTTGRIASLKGWKLMVDSFSLFEKNIDKALLYFVGEGEDKEKLMHYIYDKNLSDKIILSGKKSQIEVDLFLNASDLFIMGSYKEGWSTSLIEAIACGVPACVTNFSSATEIIEEGKTGFVVDEHKADLFAQVMLKALAIPRPTYSEKINLLSTDRLKLELLKYWKLR